jgi:signal transduction histidine kinase
VIRSGRVLAAAKAVSIELAATSSAAFTGDEDLLRRLLGNLLDNAVRHAPSGSVVDIVLERTAPGYEVSVSDRGPGVAPEMQPHIFERFYRGDDARTGDGRRDGGAGLGLALSRWIARVHHGDVKLVRSSAGGTTFKVFLPDRT